ncbi:fibronectin type III domain-containing protein [Nocardioides marmoraquaticus]
MIHPVLTRGAAVLAALALGLACVPELADAGSAVAQAGSGPTTTTTTTTTGEASVEQAAAAPDRAEYDEILPRSLSGEQLLARRGDLVPEVAERNAMSPGRLAQLLRDETVRVSVEGHVYVVEPAFEAPQRAAATVRGSTTQQAEAGSTLGSVPTPGVVDPTQDALSLQSRPGASRTIFLDVDGADVSGTTWNTAVPNGNHPGFNQSGSDPATFDAAELAFVRQVWRQVAETYAPFDVNVTTRDPGRDAWTRTGTADTTYGSRVVLTSSTAAQSALCGDCAGVAGLNTFGKVDANAYYQPAWVFVTDFARTAPTIVAQTVSHEVGHNVGLDHDGGPDQNGVVQEYTFGSRRWGPIMGGGTQRAVSHWSRGEYGGATNTEDDLAIITRNNLPLVQDDHADSPGSATDLGASTSYDVEGVISTRNDVDVFRVDVACTLSLDARANGIGPQGTLDVRLDLLSSAGTQLASNAPTTTHSQTWDTATGSWRTIGMDAALTTSLPPGTYFLRVDGSGSGSATNRDMLGWSDYGSLGRYRLTATSCDAPALPSPTPTATPSDSPSPEDPSTTPSSTPSSTPSATPATGTPSADAPVTSSPSAPPTSTPTSTPASAPGAPVMGAAGSGRRGGTVSVTLRWSPPTALGGSPLTGYRITASRLDSRNRVVRRYTTPLVSPSRTAVEVRLPKGRYRLVVQAVNPAGTSPASAPSRIVTAR